MVIIFVVLRVVSVDYGPGRKKALGVWRGNGHPSRYHKQVGREAIPNSDDFETGNGVNLHYGLGLAMHLFASPDGNR